MRCFLPRFFSHPAVRCTKGCSRCACCFGKCHQSPQHVQIPNVETMRFLPPPTIRRVVQKRATIQSKCLFQLCLCRIGQGQGLKASNVMVYGQGGIKRNLVVIHLYILAKVTSKKGESSAQLLGG